ncbi:hypothetical protein [Brevundimonas sp.]|jgi:hypothetical protein|uniref:hypothetical protein n=1 Tax=Brevundimonas sp. TaxID=1871086 RepID=UPI002E0ED4C3|nr:hypothetical protein [Brevundimonas sp.]
MEVRENIVVWIDREPTLDEELAAVDDEDVLEMANLDPDETGVPAVVMISTIMGKHGPRVKCFLKPGRSQPSFSVTIGADPRVVAKSEEFDDRDLRRLAPLVIRWVELNHQALTEFWWRGNDLTNKQVQTFIADLKKV